MLDYIMGHFSKFITPGSVRIGINHSKKDISLKFVAFKRPDGKVVMIIQNRASSILKRDGTKKYEIKINQANICGEILNDSIQTLLISL
jgi:O-glycosyl hydrolase